MGIEKHLGQLLIRLAGNQGREIDEVLLALAHSITEQHSCIDLTVYPQAVTDALHRSRLVSNDGSTPLVIEHGRLYLQKYFSLERDIVARLLALNHQLENIDEERCLAAVQAQFEPASDAQVRAGLLALTRRLLIITGGPGTGKTSTIVSILRTITAFDPASLASIALAVPTGKAAMRLSQALRQGSIQAEVMTIHRLLGMRRDGRSFRHDGNHPVSASLLIVDEASMIDIHLMDRLLAAMPRDARLILLGDPDQLPAVETGNVLADICKEEDNLLTRAICRLETNYRFDPDRGIGRLAQMIREGLPVADDVSDADLSLVPLDRAEPRALCDHYRSYIDTLGSSADVMASAFDRVRILAPLRDGDHGVDDLNREIEFRLAEAGTINLVSGDPWYHGRPVMVTRNSYPLGLFNGDVGICVRDDHDSPTVVFRRDDGSFKSYLPTRLPPHETCFAMTVHKSQGSEFDEVALVMPADPGESGERILNRSLIYTAVTRARSRLVIYGSLETLNRCVARQISRQSGITARLRDRSGAQA